MTRDGDRRDGESKIISAKGKREGGHDRKKGTEEEGRRKKGDTTERRELGGGKKGEGGYD